MSSLVFEIVLILALILGNGLLAMAEIALISSRKPRLMERAGLGDEKARVALQLAENPKDMLSMVQIGITLVGVLAGAFGGATVAEYLAIWIAKLPGLSPYSDGIALTVVVLVITYLSLVAGELVPKRLALNNPERIAARVAPPMLWMARLTSPLVRLLSASTDLVLRLMRVRPGEDPPVTEDEIKVLLSLGTQAGVFEAAEQQMVTSIFRLGDRRVSTIMTPRTEAEWLDLDDPLEVNLAKISESLHSRFPLARGSLDNVQGIILAKDLLARCMTNQPFDLQMLSLPPVFVPENIQALKALEIFKESGQQLVLVIDEFGGLQGLVTVSDILEVIIGDIPRAGQMDEPDIIRRDDGSWLVDGMLPIDEFMDTFQLPALPDHDKGYYETLGGFMMSYLGRIPTAGDFFEWEGLRFEVVDMDGFRVDKIMIQQMPADSPATILKT